VSVDALLVLQRSDVDHIAAQRDRFAGLRLLFIDPGILDAALQAGLPNYELRRLDVDRDISALAYAQAMHGAAAIDLALTEQRRALWGQGAFHGWDLTLLYLTLQRCWTMRALGRAIEQACPEPRLGLLRPAHPALFNWDSMLSTDIVGADPARWSVVGGYAQARHWTAAMLDVCFDFDGVRRHAEAGHADCVTHIPTCFYDVPAFAAAVSQTFEHNIDLPAMYCDVPVRRGPELLLRRLGDASFDADCSAYRERARAIYTEHLAPLIPHKAALQQQAAALARRSHLQAVNFIGLRRALAGTRPHFVLGDHDVGANGPLFTLAAELGSDITVLPHSAYPTALMPHAQRVTVIERDGFGVPVRTVLGQPVATRAVRFRAPVVAAPRLQPRRLCLLLNTMLSEGLSYVELFALIGFFKPLAALCQRHGWDLSVRLKPGQAALNVVASALQMPPGWFKRTMEQPVAEVAREADVCVAFGEPTSATIAFFDAGAYLLHVSEQNWPSDYVITTPLKGTLMPSLRCAEALAELDALMSDPALYASRQQSQAAAYALRRAGAHDTIFPPRPLTQGA
jgi:hypothetical protein